MCTRQMGLVVTSGRSGINQKDLGVLFQQGNQLSGFDFSDAFRNAGDLSLQFGGIGRITLHGVGDNAWFTLNGILHTLSLVIKADKHGFGGFSRTNFQGDGFCQVGNAFDGAGRRLDALFRRLLLGLSWSRCVGLLCACGRTTHCQEQGCKTEWYKAEPF